LKLEAQIIKRMLERIGLKVTLDILTFPEMMRKTYVPLMDKPYEETDWDISFWRPLDWAGHTAVSILVFETDRSDWRMIEYDGVYEKMWEDMARTVDRKAQEEKIRQMAKYVHDHAYRIRIYSPISLYAVNKEVNFVPRSLSLCASRKHP